jgi:hypothetical protein
MKTQLIGLKGLLSGLSVLAICLTATAQGSLQFNQVKLVTSQETVPAGKVWKVVSPMLGLNQGIRVSPFFFINSDTIVLGYDSYNVSRWENVTSIVVQARGNFCNSNTEIRMRFLGSGGGSAIDQDNTQGFIGNLSQFTTVATFTPPSPGNNEIDRWSFWLRNTAVSTGVQNGEFRVVVNLANGSQIVNTYGPTSLNSSCNTNWWGTPGPTSTMTNFIGSPSATIALDRTDRNRPQISTPFPIWLPAGATLGAGGNIRGISVIEFNILP